MKKLILSLMTVFFANTAQAAIITKEIPYKDGDVALTGYLAYDDSIKTPIPGVVIVHEWWGHNDYARKRAEDVAKLGYAAFAIDMYGTGKKVETPAEAQALSKPFYDDRNLMRSRAMAGLDVLKTQTMVDSAKIAIIGYCFGGTVALETARGGSPVLGAVSFHGGLATPMPAAAGKVHARILALNGADDPMVKPEEVAGFEKEMKDAAINYTSISYPGAIHAFTNPAATDIGKKYNIPVAYNEDADKKSWQEMKTFLADIFK